jgi:RimJ/RimL family protein N-acetyltransferase
MDIAAINRIRGPELTLRLIEPSDAKYVHDLRTNTSYGKYLSPVTGGIIDQEYWIKAYKAREARREEFYYVIQRRDSVRCGLVRLYDITTNSFTWGSWILDYNKPPKAALESALLSFGVGFDLLGLTRASVDVRIENQHARNFYHRLGMTESHRTSQDIFFNYTRDRYHADRDRLFSILSECPKN